MEVKDITTKMKLRKMGLKNVNLDLTPKSLLPKHWMAVDLSIPLIQRNIDQIHNMYIWK